MCIYNKNKAPSKCSCFIMQTCSSFQTQTLFSRNQTLLCNNRETNLSQMYIYQLKYHRVSVLSNICTKFSVLNFNEDTPHLLCLKCITAPLLQFVKYCRVTSEQPALLTSCNHRKLLRLWFFNQHYYKDCNLLRWLIGR